MQFSNFNLIFEQSSARLLEFDGLIWDLYNGFLNSFRFDVSTHTFIISWLADQPRQADETNWQGKEIELAFHNVTVLEVSRRDQSMPMNEDEKLDTIGYISRDENFSEWTLENMVGTYRPNEDYADDDIAIRFWGGQTIRIRADTVTANRPENPRALPDPS